MVKKLLILTIFFSAVNNVFSQERDTTRQITLKDRLFLSGPYGISYSIQGQYSNQLSSNFFGMQFKRLKTDGEIGFSSISVSSVSFSYGMLNKQGYYCTDANYHFGMFPLTLVFSIGIGGSFISNFRNNNLFSLYPSIYLDLGGVELSYHYKFRISNTIPDDYSYHTLKLNLGLRFWRKNKK